ncbi:hypothetical protein ABT214_03395 [Micromonospora purpureochromogenes]|uniref:hypothetical protein n=1 Tax=Micromonospora purpureochromogenes TaxID=47872 RepID=UPI0033330337
MSLTDDMRQASLLDNWARQSAAALVLVRYCNLHQDPKFSPWFEQHREHLSRSVDLATRICRQGTERSAEIEDDVAALRGSLGKVIDGSDPDGPPFETEVVDHLVLATEVLDFVAAPDELDELQEVFERAEELAEAAREMGERDFPGGERKVVDFVGLENEARHADLAELRSAQQDGRHPNPANLIPRSESFARQYADVIEKCYSDEDAGRS